MIGDLTTPTGISTAKNMSQGPSAPQPLASLKNQCHLFNEQKGAWKKRVSTWGRDPHASPSAFPGHPGGLCSQPLLCWGRNLGQLFKHCSCTSPVISAMAITDAGGKMEVPQDGSSLYPWAPMGKTAVLQNHLYLQPVREKSMRMLSHWDLEAVAAA